MSEPKPPPVALVVWHDAFHQPGEHSMGDKMHIVRCSVGHLIHEDSDGVKLAQTMENDGTGPEDVLTIDGPMVQSIRTVRSLNKEG